MSSSRNNKKMQHTGNRDSSQHNNVKFRQFTKFPSEIDFVESEFKANPQGKA